VDTLLAGVRALRPDETRLLVATADIPFLTPASVADFLRQAARYPDATLVYPIVPADLCADRFPQMKRTTLRIREGAFTGGNLVLLEPAFLREHEAVLRAAYARRKSVVGLARLLGAPILLRLAASRVAPGLLAVAHLEAAVGRALGGARARAVVCPFAEVGADVDRPEDLDFARRWAAASSRRGDKMRRRALKPRKAGV
jgi:CTP:molybdopterin cytidylyltransferase MocA